MTRVAVVGAGLGGLTAAYRLQQAGCDVDVFEASDVAGGRVQTVRDRGFSMDTGASALGSTYHGYLALAAELGVEIIDTAPHVGIQRNGAIHLLDMNHMARTGLQTRLLSLGGKARVARLAVDVAMAKLRGRLDYADMAKAAPLDTESARGYAVRALSRELDSYLCEPIVRTMLIADTDKVSKVELFSGIANIFTAKIQTVAGGQGRMVDALCERLDVQLRTPVTEVRRLPGGVRVTRKGEVSDYDAAVVNCVLPEAVALCPDDRAVLESLSRSLDYTMCVSVAVGTTRAPDCPAFLLMFPSTESPDIALMFLDHNKAPDRAPAGRGLLSCLWEAGASERMIDLPDEVLIEHTLKSVYASFPELRGTVDYTHVTRWRRALPFTRIGAYREIGRLNAALDPRSPVQYAADFMSAAGQNTAVEFGRRAAQNLLAGPLATATRVN
ncbi:oxygen-dependent protoporphyrinogen oxidase [Mycolicibacterium sp. BK556]|uniref:protoporphyrinogen/coproporphyrinogen oxidase n=1 Tax=unclassified Mycolicibacterium TaxID=2636767 RepID=UPI001619D780|nr:oxygen-dependent protoporphyrinogen oxidase [Mycolicibacterium sp. BK556]MBB3630342.1 oxygen-dependent protoporphyrinogen oxidase [Mycolicibacterium sp. BK607]MBB3748341.1 oxygen-dependent protoporphyrinogen oxidase [Mycolicibacterium sp. BK634]